jgi:DNA-binding beta-propeller fold protein YncE
MALRSPRGLAISPDGSLVVADTGNDRAVVLDRKGRLLRTFGHRCRLEQGAAGGCTDEDGSGPQQNGDGQFLEPWGVAVSPQGTIFLADTWNGRIQAFDPMGSFLWKWGSYGNTGGITADPHLLFGPRGLAVSIDGELLVTDTGNKRVLRFREGGEFLAQAGGPGAVPGRFDEPVGIVIDPGTRDVFVADAWNQRIQRFNAKLEYLEEWRVSGWTARDAESKPFLAVDSRGNVFATDPGRSRVLVFDSRGNLRHYLRDMGGQLGSLNHPTGIAVDPRDDALWVADSGNDRILRLRGTDRAVDRLTAR